MAVSSPQSEHGMQAPPFFDFILKFYLFMLCLGMGPGVISVQGPRMAGIGRINERERKKERKEERKFFWQEKSCVAHLLYCIVCNISHGVVISIIPPITIFRSNRQGSYVWSRYHCSIPPKIGSIAPGCTCWTFGYGHVCSSGASTSQPCSA